MPISLELLPVKGDASLSMNVRKATPMVANKLNVLLVVSIIAL
jgi:hypothetical protein